MKLFEEFNRNLRKYYNYDIQYKNESKLIKALSYVLFFNRKFMTSFVTTIGKTIYVPNRDWLQDDYRAINLISHEAVHVEQARKYSPVVFSILYLFPQILSVLALLAILAIFWKPFFWCLLFLVFLAPLQAPFRTYFEFQGYTMSLFADNLQMEQLGYKEAEIEANLVISADYYDKKNFRGSNYYFMWPFGLRKAFTKKIKAIRNDDIVSTERIYDHVQRSYLAAVDVHEKL